MVVEASERREVTKTLHEEKLLLLGAVVHMVELDKCASHLFEA